MTAQLLCQVQNFAVTTQLEFALHQNEISVKFELWGKFVSDADLSIAFQSDDPSGP